MLITIRNRSQLNLHTNILGDKHLLDLSRLGQRADNHRIKDSREGLQGAFTERNDYLASEPSFKGT